MAGMVQAQSLRGYRELVSDLGGNPTRLLRKAGVDPSTLNQLTAFIGFDILADLLELSATELACPDFGLRLAERQDIGILDTLAVAIRYSATVGEAAQCASKYLPVYTGALVFAVSSGTPRGVARLMYFATMWSYLSGFAAVVYLIAPVFYLTLGAGATQIAGACSGERQTSDCPCPQQR